MAAASALAQPARPARDPEIENVIVTAQRLPEVVIHAFVQSYAHMVSASFEKITRWKKPICVGTDGLSSEALNLFVTERVNQIATQAGVAVDTFPCKFNIEVIFSSAPQEFLNDVRARGPVLLSSKRSRLNTVAVMRYPLQAWYATGIEDRDGTLILNDEETVGYTSGGGLGPLSTVPSLHVEGSLLRNGLRSEMAHVYVIADTNRTSDFRLGPIADYIAMLALSQSQSFDECRPLPSITNLFAGDCGEHLKPAAITNADIAFLRGLYRMDPGANILTQQSAIAAEIEKALTAKDF